MLKNQKTTTEEWRPGGNLPEGSIYRSYRYRLYPNKAQVRQLAQQLGANRWVWNYFLGLMRDQPNARFSYSQMSAHLTVVKRQEGLTWLKSANAQSLQQTLLDLSTAQTRYKQGLSGKPAFKRKFASWQAFRVPQGFHLDADAERLYLPKFATGLKIVVHRPLHGEPRSVTVGREADGQWYASILCVVPHTPPAHAGGACGIDVGLKTFAVVADDFGKVTRIEKPPHLRQAEQRLKRLQRSLSRRVKGSAGYARTRRQLARLHAKVRRQRADFLHQASAALTDDYAVIAVEDLNIEGMRHNHHLAKSIGDAGWGTFKNQLKYKAAWKGGRVVEQARFFPSSKTCSACGHVMAELPLNVREWQCPQCGEVHDRDINAAANLLLSLS